MSQKCTIIVPEPIGMHIATVACLEPSGCLLLQRLHAHRPRVRNHRGPFGGLSCLRTVDDLEKELRDEKMDEMARLKTSLLQEHIVSRILE